MNMSGVQVGHIPKTVAARLAPMMDRQLVTVEGEMVQGNLYGNPFQLSIDLAIYAPESIRDQLTSQLRWAAPAPARRNSKLVPLPPTQNQTGVQGTTSPSKGKGKAGSSSSSAAASIAAEPGETAAQTAARQRQMQQVLGALQRINGDEKRGDEVSPPVLKSEARSLSSSPTRRFAGPRRSQRCQGRSRSSLPQEPSRNCLGRPQRRPPPSPAARSSLDAQSRRAETSQDRLGRPRAAHQVPDSLGRRLLLLPQPRLSSADVGGAQACSRWHGE